MSTPVSSRQRRHAERRAARLEAERAAATSATRRRRLLRLGAAVLVAAALVGIAAALSSSSSNPQSSDGPAAAAVGGREAATLLAGIPERDGVLGDPRAPLTLTEYVDLQCPVCAEASAATFPTLVRDYVRTGKVRLQLRTLHFLGADSARAARFAAGADRQGRLFRFLDVFYANQGAENTGYVTDGFLRSVARAADVDPAPAFRQTGSAFATGRLARADADAARLGVAGTPTFALARGHGASRVLSINPLDPTSVGQALDAELAR
jgi:protein-disulfide isomerase